MNGILIINKPKDYTSRDIVTIVSKKIGPKKIGHTGTLDPLATGVLVLPIGKALKIAELLTAETKTYIAKVLLGYETDTLDVTGNELKRNIPSCTKEKIENVLNSFIGKSNQQVPMYSAVKVGGKKLYEYARKGIEVTPPTKEIEVFSIELLDEPTYISNMVEFTIKCKVSKGTYIISLIRDIGYKLGTYGTMKELNRIEQGIFNLDNSYTLDDIEKGSYKLLSIKESLPNIKITKVEDNLLKKIKNGMVLDSFFEEELSLIIDENNNEIAIYKQIGEGKVKPFKMIEV